MKNTIRQKVEELLKRGWYTNYQMQMIIRSSSADREARYFRKNTPDGYVFRQRIKQNSDRRCYEYTLIKV